MNEQGTVNVLVVDDEPTVLMVVGLFVTAALPKGLVEVTKVGNLAAAKELKLGDIDLIICDMTLSHGETGFDLLRYLRGELGLQTPFMLMTGYSPEEVAEKIRPGETFSRFSIIHKPFKDFADVRARIEVALDAPP